MTDKLEAAEILDQAADEVSKEWCQESYGAWYTNEGPVCALGAIKRVTQAQLLIEGTTPWLSAVSLSHTISETDLPLGVDGTYLVPRWNDAPGRTAGEVADAMRSTAKRLREEATPHE